MAKKRLNLSFDSHRNMGDIEKILEFCTFTLRFHSTFSTNSNIYNSNRIKTNHTQHTSHINSGTDNHFSAQMHSIRVIAHLQNRRKSVYCVPASKCARAHSPTNTVLLGLILPLHVVHHVHPIGRRQRTIRLYAVGTRRHILRLFDHTLARHLLLDTSLCC